MSTKNDMKSWSEPEELSFTPPTIEEVVAQFKSISQRKDLLLTAVQAMAFAENYISMREENEWVKINGKRVKNWKLDLNTWLNNYIINGQIKTRGMAW